MWVLFGSRLLVVRSVEVTGTHLVPKSEVLAAAGILKGVPLIRVNTGAVADRVDRITQVQSARVTRSWPDGVVIAVQERKPALAVPAAGRFDLVDPSGVVVQQMMVSTSPASMPASANASRAAASARSDVFSPSLTKRRSRMPVRSRIQASDVSTNLARSSLVTIFSGK